MVNVEVVTFSRIPFHTTLGSLAPKRNVSCFSWSGMPQVDWTCPGLCTRVHVLACHGRIRTRLWFISRPVISTGWDYRTDFPFLYADFPPVVQDSYGGISQTTTITTTTTTTTTNSADEETITATIVTSASDPIRSECSFFDTLIIVQVKTLKWNPILLYCYTVSK